MQRLGVSDKVTATLDAYALACQAFGAGDLPFKSQSAVRVHLDQVLTLECDTQYQDGYASAKADAEQGRLL